MCTTVNKIITFDTDLQEHQSGKCQNTFQAWFSPGCGAIAPSSVHNRGRVTETNHRSHSPLQPSSPSRGNTNLF